MIAQSRPQNIQISAGRESTPRRSGAMSPISRSSPSDPDYFQNSAPNRRNNRPVSGAKSNALYRSCAACQQRDEPGCALQGHQHTNDTTHSRPTSYKANSPKPLLLLLRPSKCFAATPCLAMTKSASRKSKQSARAIYPYKIGPATGREDGLCRDAP